MTEITIPPLQRPEEPYTAAQLECYIEKGEAYLANVAECVSSGGTNAEIQACINAANVKYLALLQLCDTL